MSTLTEENERILKAIQDVVDQQYARPLLLGDPQTITERVTHLGLRVKIDRDFDVIEPTSRIIAARLLSAKQLVKNGDADGVLYGPSGDMQEKIDCLLEHYSEDSFLAFMYLLLLDAGSVFITDTGVNENPDPEQLVKIVQYASQEVRRFGMDPIVALVSHSNFGSHRSASSSKMAKAKELLSQTNPNLIVEGEIKADVALSALVREKTPLSTLKSNANLLVMPNLDAANITYRALKSLASGVAIGPIVLGAKMPIHGITSTTTPRGIVNLSSLVASSIV